jgi:hypothetical protein
LWRSFKLRPLFSRASAGFCGLLHPLCSLCGVRDEKGFARRLKHHKIESIELLPGADGIAAASDDENLGSWLCFASQ